MPPIGYEDIFWRYAGSCLGGKALPCPFETPERGSQHEPRIVSRIERHNLHNASSGCVQVIDRSSIRAAIPGVHDHAQCLPKSGEA